MKTDKPLYSTNICLSQSEMWLANIFQITACFVQAHPLISHTQEMIFWQHSEGGGGGGLQGKEEKGAEFVGFYEQRKPSKLTFSSRS